MAVALRDVATEDWPLIDRWLHADHVRRFWGEPEENARLLRRPPPDTHCSLIEADGRKVGLIVWQNPPRQELDEAGLDGIPTSVIDIDIMIGERDAVGRGIGSAAIRIAADLALADRSVPYVIAGTADDNTASLRAFEKAGFQREREFDDPVGGPFILLVRRRTGADRPAPHPAAG